MTVVLNIVGSLEVFVATISKKMEVNLRKEKMKKKINLFHTQQHSWKSTCKSFSSGKTQKVNLVKIRDR